ncbi:MAG: hypothetical protein ACR2P5_08280 [Gammaproteobacteria bacterium]
MALDIRESQIEDALVGAAGLARRVLHLENEPCLLARQMDVPSGRLDLLYACQKDLILVELKSVGFNRKFLGQVLGYRNDLIEYQNSGKLVEGKIKPYLLCTNATERAESGAAESGVTLMQYSPQEVLSFFYENFKPVAFFTEKKPVDIGIWNLHLINKFIYFMDGVSTMEKLKEAVGGSGRTLYNKVKFAEELRLVNWKPHGDSVSLTELGERYAAAKNALLPARISEEQASILQKFIMTNPYESAVILGIASIVESVFILSKNAYPVHARHLTEYFPYFAGKFFTWKTAKAKTHAVRMYSNYAADLGLLAKTRDTFYLTPDGLRFTIQMQMHKNIKLVESVKIA